MVQDALFCFVDHYKRSEVAPNSSSRRTEVAWLCMAAASGKVVGRGCSLVLQWPREDEAFGWWGSPHLQGTTHHPEASCSGSVARNLRWNCRTWLSLATLRHTSVCPARKESAGNCSLPCPVLEHSWIGLESIRPILPISSCRCLSRICWSESALARTTMTLAGQFRFQAHKFWY